MAILKITVDEIGFGPMISAGPTITVSTKSQLGKIAALLKKPIIVCKTKQYVFDGKTVYVYKDQTTASQTPESQTAESQ